MLFGRWPLMFCKLNGWSLLGLQNLLNASL
jgi:hypothetical protein